MSDAIQEAVRLIVRLYREPDLLRRLRETPEQLDRLLETMVEIAKGEEGRVPSEIAEAAAQSGVDAKSVVDGANFLLSLLHAGPEGNPYRVLGLERGASQEAIKRRWRLLMQIYHPDRYSASASGGWVAERAKQINEAYATLKDEEERRRVDAEQNLAPHAPPARATGAAASSWRPAGSGISWSLYLTPLWRKRLPRLVMAALLGGASIIVAIVYLANYPSEPPVKVAKKEVKSQAVEPPVEASGPRGFTGRGATALYGESGVKSEETSPAPLLKSPPTLALPPLRGEEQGGGVDSREGRGEVKRQDNPPIPPLAKGGEGGFEKPEVRSQESGRSPDSIGANENRQRELARTEVRSRETSDKTHGTLLSWRAVKKETPREEKKGRLPAPIESGPAGKAGTLSPEPAPPAAPAQPEAPPAPSVKVDKTQETVAAPSPRGEPVARAAPDPPPAPPPKRDRVTTEEVRRFLAEYTAAFERGDIGRFMTLFSRSAVENGSRTYEEIRSAYAASFQGKEKTRYLVKDVAVDPSGKEAVVRGRFEIAQQRKQDGRKMEAQGAIRWRLIREGEQLKVATVDYVRQ